MFQNKTHKTLTAFDLKNIAVITMIIDHIGFCFYPNILWFRIIGRCSFVLFAFLLTQGFIHSSNLNAYKKRLFIWGLISEVPYDLFFYNSLSSFEGQNIFFTLLLGLIGLEFAEKRKSFIFKTLILLASMYLAYLLNLDYSAYGVALIYLFYYVKDLGMLLVASIPIIGLLGSIELCIIQIFSILGLALTCLYNGKRGKRTGIIYYSFYPMHLLIFYILNIFL